MVTEFGMISEPVKPVHIPKVLYSIEVMEFGMVSDPVKPVQ